MANTVIRIKKSGISGNVPSSLEFGELAINYHDGKLFYKDHNGIITQLSGSGGGGNSFSVVNANNTLFFATTPGDIMSFTSSNGISVSANVSTKTVNVDGSEVLSMAQNATNFYTFNSSTVIPYGRKNILVDTTDGPVTITLPTGINTGYSMIIGDGGGDKQINPAYIVANGSTINGSSNSLEFNAPDVLFYMIYTGTTWKVLLNG